jgi:hypothetical protein
MDTELLQNTLTVNLYGARADAKLLGNHLVGIALDQQLHHFPFAISQGFKLFAEYHA